VENSISILPPSRRAGQERVLPLRWQRAISFHSEADFSLDQTEQLHSRKSKVEVRRTRHGRSVGANKLEQQHERPTSVYCGQWLEKIQLVEPILKVNLSAEEWSASLLSL